MSEEKRAKRWFPLESNPEVMTAYVKKMGFPTDQFSFCDVMSTEEWALGMVPSPVVAVLMLFPIKPHVRCWRSRPSVLAGLELNLVVDILLLVQTEAFAKQEAEKIAKEGQTVSPNVYYMRQTVAGLSLVLLVLVKPRFSYSLADTHVNMWTCAEPDSYLGKFFEETKAKTPKEIAEYLEDDDEVKSAALEETHGSAAEAGQSEQLEHVDDPINTHFVCFRWAACHLSVSELSRALSNQILRPVLSVFSCVDGHLYELDGRKKSPINHGPSSEDTLLKVSGS
ncbi:hypothetical protein BBJ28_00017191, partial [Nothophytophthora sp. Chile5]